MNTNPTTFHFVRHFASVFKDHGFEELPQQQTTNVAPGRYFTTLEDQSLVAFVKGGRWNPSQGSCFVGTHVDAVGIKVVPAGLKPQNTDAQYSQNPQNCQNCQKDVHKNTYQELTVASYSGPIKDLWVQRDLGLAGIVIVKTADGSHERVLVDSKEPIGTIALIPEFVNTKPNYNVQTAKPIVGLSSSSDPTPDEARSPLLQTHSLPFLRYVSGLALCSLVDIVSLDLHLYDTQHAVRGGLDREFIYSSSLDDRLCSYDAAYGLLAHSDTIEDVAEFDGLIGVYFANHEEIGSGLRTGAQGGLLLDTLKRVVGSPAELLQLTANTVFLSSDVTHCLNPNFRDIYLENHMPQPNVGPTIKIDLNEHVLTDSIGHYFLQQLTQQYVPDVRLQQFHIRNDSRSGGTIGPIMSGRRGLNGARLIIDVGMPILSMHSVRSIMGAKDVGLGISFFRGVFAHWRDVPSEILYEY